jgi:hypothetical protein
VPNTGAPFRPTADASNAPSPFSTARSLQIGAPSHDFEALAPLAAPETLARRTSSETHDFHADKCRTCGNVDPGRALRIGAIVDDRALRQPFKQRPVGDLRVQLLGRRPIRRSIPARRAGSRELRACVAADRNREHDAIAADDSRRRMQDHALAHVRTFGIQRLLHDSGPRCSRRAETLRPPTLEPERQCRLQPACPAACPSLPPTDAGCGVGWRDDPVGIISLSNTQIATHASRPASGGRRRRSGRR